MAKRTLAEVDELYGGPDLPWVVEPWKNEPTGVDPLGLRQTNLDMMDRLLPGINNVTRHIRIYTLMTWAWWKARQVLSDGGEHSFWSKEMVDYVERVDAIFSWSQFLMKPDASLPGSTVLPRKLDQQNDVVAYDFGAPAWDELRASRRNSTDLLGAIQYGPSIRGVGGLRWLEAREGVFAPTQEVMDAVRKFDALVAPHLPKCLLDPRHKTISYDEVKAIAHVWHYREPTSVEQEAFAERFFGNQALEKEETGLARRRATLRLMMEALSSAGAPCSVETVRARMFGVDALPSSDASVERARRRWRVLQLRQLQRLAIEALYIVVEAKLEAGSAPTTVLVERIIDDLADAAVDVSADGAAMLATAFASWTAEPDRAVFDLMARLETAQSMEVPAVPRLALAAIQCVDLLARQERSNEDGAAIMKAFEHETDRLPLGLMLERLDELRAMPAVAMIREIIEAWVFGQHLRWSVMRGGDGKQRLRVGLDEGGWTLLRRDLSATFGATPDRLRSALRLSAGCGLIAVSGRPEDELWTAAASA